MPPAAARSASSSNVFASTRREEAPVTLLMLDVGPAPAPAPGYPPTGEDELNSVTAPVLPGPGGRVTTEELGVGTRWACDDAKEPRWCCSGGECAVELGG